jgi:hypothetical protein
MRTRILALTLVISIFTISAQAQFSRLKSYAVNAGLSKITESWMLLHLRQRFPFFPGRATERSVVR